MASDPRVKDLKQRGDREFSRRLPVVSLWQEIADNFYPERADFTASRTTGEDFASNLTTSYPLMARRELADAFSSMLRSKDWFHIGTDQGDDEDNDARQWLEQKTKIMRRAMYDPESLFVRSTKEGDNDFAAFGQCVITVELNQYATGLLYRCRHLRDVAWCEDSDGKTSEIHDNITLTAREMNRLFRGKVDEKVKKCLEKEPYREFNCRRVVMPADYYEGEGKWRTPFVSVYYDCENDFLLEEKGFKYNPYVIPRWQTVSGSQYAHSPATIISLPDARLIQSITLVLLEAGEKAVDPPALAAMDAIRGDIGLYAGGITYYEPEYNEQQAGPALRYLTNDKSGIPFGMDMQEAIRNAIAQAFYLNKLTLPQLGGDKMTAYEVGQRVQEYIRGAMPLFSPMESEYNGGLCMTTFDLMLQSGGFGPADEIPESIRGADVQFRFESPLHEAEEQNKGQIFMQTKALLAEAAALDQTIPAMVDAKTAIRDVLRGIKTPAKWVRSEEDMQGIEEGLAQQQQAQEMLAAMQQGGAAAEQIGKAGQAIKGLEV